jgi:hypothetical protein
MGQRRTGEAAASAAGRGWDRRGQSWPAWRKPRR